jgi:hypothetical protein
MCIQEHVIQSVAVFVGNKHGMMSRVSNFLNTGPFFPTTNLVSPLLYDTIKKVWQLVKIGLWLILAGIMEYAHVSLAL